MTLRRWVLRPILWFAVASMTVTILHELAHACAAFALGVRSTLFSYFAELDLTAAQAATNLPALIRVAGPLFCLAFGALSWFAFSRTRSSFIRLPLLFLSVFGVGTFCGNLLSAASIGDFSAVADSLQLPMVVRYMLAATGVVAMAALHFWAGRELMQAVPGHVGRVMGTLALVVGPAVLGTAAVILVNQPMPGVFAGARALESSFWLFAVIGALTTRTRSADSLGRLELRWADGGVALLAVMVVRLMVRGIPFSP